MRTHDDVRRLVRDAEQRGRELDAIDQAYGFATPAAVGEREFLMTVDAAIEAGLQMDDASYIAEALVLIRQRLMFLGEVSA